MRLMFPLLSILLSASSCICGETEKPDKKPETRQDAFEQALLESPASKGMPRLKSIDEEGLRQATDYSFDKGYRILVAEVLKPVKIKGIGTDGAQVTLGPSSITLLADRTQGERKPGDKITLYPFTDAAKVILLHHSRGNWIEWTDQNESIVKDELAKLNKKKE